jgi:hypothetical protein
MIAFESKPRPLVGRQVLYFRHEDSLSSLSALGRGPG